MYSTIGANRPLSKERATYGSSPVTEHDWRWPPEGEAMLGLLNTVHGL